MYINSEKYQFKIKAIEQNIAPYIEKKQNGSYLLCAPASMPEKELIIFVKNNETQLVHKFEQKIEKCSDKDIILYNRKMRYEHVPNSLISCRSNNSIFSPILPYFKSNTSKIKREILLYDIKQIIAFWEELLDVIVETIKIKNYKTKAFHICHKETIIYFNEYLINQNFNYVHYVVTKALFEYLKLNQHEQESLMKEYVQDWKHSSKILDFEKNGRS